MKKQRVLYTEAAYLIGLFVLAVGTALMERADFGMSMVVAPAYIVYLKVSQFFGWFTFGMAEYCFQALLLLGLTCALRCFKPMYLFSFCTAFLYGQMLDLSIFLVGFLPMPGAAARVIFFVLGLVFGSFGVAMLFNTYIAPEAYELVVKEVSPVVGKPISQVKTFYDCISCAAAVLLSFLFFGFGHFEGVKLGTVLCAVINGWLIGRISHALQSSLTFRDGLKLRKYFT